jgi:hypothetical protein
VELTVQHLNVELITSQDRSSLFKNWLVGKYDFA